METVQEKKDVRDEILEYLKEDSRSIVWLAKKSEINYYTVYSCFKKRLFNLTEENLAKINAALGTDFKQFSAFFKIKKSM